MKKYLLILMAMICFGISANAQKPDKPNDRAQSEEPKKAQSKTELGKKIGDYLEKANQPKEVREERKAAERANTKNEVAKEIDKHLEKLEKKERK
jgi:hypothetical protein